MLKKHKYLILILFFTLVIGGNTMAQSSNKYFVTKDNVAINGYDVVAYFTQNEAVEGNSKFSSKYNGVTFQFANENDKKTFEANPEKYLPQYGGYCAFAMAAKNAKVPADPKTFKLYNGKLYLFFNDLWDGKKFNTIIPWNADEKHMKATADENWNKMK